MSKGVCEEKVFQSVFMSCATEVRNFIYYKSGDMAQAEDLTQDAFSKLWQNCAKVELEKAKGFLYTIVNRLFLNQIQHDKVKLKFINQQDRNRLSESPEFILEEKEFKNRLESAIQALPENQRIVFLMNRIDKKKYREIAEDLGLSVKAVEKRMHNALQALRKVHHKV